MLMLRGGKYDNTLQAASPEKNEEFMKLILDTQGNVDTQKHSEHLKPVDFSCIDWKSEPP